MKLSIKTILSIFLITALSILLVGCWAVPPEEAPGVTPPIPTPTLDNPDAVYVNLNMAVYPEGGTTTPEVGTHAIEMGNVVTIVAIPDAGYEFTEWSVAENSEYVADTSAESTEVTMFTDMTLTANFRPVSIKIEYSLTLNAGSGGSVTGGGTYEEGTVVGIEATPEEHYEFTEWTVDSGDSANVADTGASSTDVTMNEDMTLTANFSKIQHTLTLDYNWLYVGWPVFDWLPGGSVTGAGTYDEGEVVDIYAYSEWWTYFTEWSGDISNVADTGAWHTQVTMNEDTNLTANFWYVW